VAGEIDAVGVVDDAIENRIGVGRIADQVVPFVDWDLAGNDGRSAAVALFENLEEIVARSGIEGFEAPIIEDEQLHTAERPQDASVATIAAGEREIGEQFWNALIEDGAVVATGLVTECARQPTLADAGWAAQDQVVVGIDPADLGELVEQRAIEAAPGAVIDILDGGLVAQPGVAQACAKPFVVAVGDLAIEQQAEPFGMGQGGAFAGCFDLAEALAMPLKPS
jgi:hypothetical protein